MNAHFLNTEKFKVAENKYQYTLTQDFIKKKLLHFLGPQLHSNHFKKKLKWISRHTLSDPMTEIFTFIVL